MTENMLILMYITVPVCLCIRINLTHDKRDFRSLTVAISNRFLTYLPLTHSQRVLSTDSLWAKTLTIRTQQLTDPLIHL